MGSLKYRFLEDFKNEKGEPDENVGSPKSMPTKDFGTRLLHRIVKIEYKDKTDAEGNKTVTESKGEFGGWIEKYDNLSQTGECWVESGAIVCGDARVAEDAIIKSNAEIGGSAKVRGKSIIKGSIISEGAHIKGQSEIKDSEVKGTAYVDNAIVSGGSKIEGGTRIEGIGEEAIEIDKSEIDGNVCFYGKKIYVNGESKLTGNVSVETNTYITKKAEISGNSIIAGSVIVGPIELEDVVSENGCIGVVANMSKAWDEAAEKEAIPGYDKPTGIEDAERF